MTLIAVTLNWKDTESTLHCVKSLLAADGISRIIVVDNESDGSLAKALKDFERTSIVEREENLGFAGGMNVALLKALEMGATRILSINNDATIDPQSVIRLSESLDTEGFALVAPTILNIDGTTQSKGDFIDKAGRTSQSQSKFTLSPFLSWACIMVSADTLSKVGLLDSRYFMYYEDVDFCLRTTKAGLSFGVKENAFATHSLNKSHAKAGIRIQMYSTAALLAFGKKWRREIPIIFTLGRVLVRILRQVGSIENMALIVKACRIGWAVQSNSFTVFGSIAVWKQQDERSS